MEKKFVEVKFTEGKYTDPNRTYYFRTYFDDLVAGEYVIVDTQYGKGIVKVVKYVSEAEVKDTLGNMKIKEVLAKIDFQEGSRKKRDALEVAMLECKLNNAIQRYVRQKNLVQKMQHGNKEYNWNKLYSELVYAANEYKDTNTKLERQKWRMGAQSEDKYVANVHILNSQLYAELKTMMKNEQLKNEKDIKKLAVEDKQLQIYEVKIIAGEMYVKFIDLN
jgi:hypothetical protein